MSTGICPAVITYCAPGQLPAPPCPCTIAQHAVPTLGGWVIALLIAAVLVAGIAALWWHAREQDQLRQTKGPQPRYPHAAEDTPGVTEITDICPRHGWPCNCTPDQRKGCEDESKER